MFSGEGDGKKKDERIAICLFTTRIMSAGEAHDITNYALNHIASRKMNNVEMKCVDSEYLNIEEFAKAIDCPVLKFIEINDSHKKNA